MATTKRKPPIPNSQRLVDKPLSFIADKAATAAVRISMEGRRAEELAIWTMVRDETDQLAVPAYFREVLKSPTFLTLLDIRLKRATLSSLEDVAFLRDTIRDVLKLAADSVLEDLIIAPEQLSTKERVKIVMDFQEMYEAMKPKTDQTGLPAPGETAVEAATQQAEEMEAALSKLPPALRERTIRQWKLDRMKELNDAESRLRSDGPDVIEAGD